MKAFYCDVETTGLDIENSAIIQLAFIIEIDGKIMVEKSMKIRPHLNAFISEAALAINKSSQEDLFATADRFTFPVVHDILVNQLKKYVDPYTRSDKFQFIGYNSASFDMPMLRKLWERCDDPFFGSYFFYPSLDVAILAGEASKENRGRMKDFKLATVAKAYGIAIDETAMHDALYDIRVTRNLYLQVQHAFRRIYRERD